jgi:hypothetical protein
LIAQHNNSINTGSTSMADIRYFSDLDGTTQPLRYLTQMENAKFAAAFPGVKGRRADGYTMWVGHPTTGADCLLPVTRMIEFKAHPSKHVCNARCLGGKVNGTCECQCGGRNHGAGMFTRILAAA